VRCPKCHYLSFEPEPRCKNCGYDLAFDSSEEVEAKPPEAEPVRRVVESKTAQAPPPPAPAPVMAAPVSAPAAPSPAPAPASAPASVAPSGANSTLELPLFVQTLSEPEGTPAGDIELIQDAEPVEDEPMVRLPPARTPLSVRRPTPAPGRVREKYHRNLLDPEPESDATASGMWIGAPAPDAEPEELALPVESRDESAGALRRLEAAFVDLLFLGTLNIAIVWLTLQKGGLSLGQIDLLPVLPLGAFLFVLNASYLLTFTATNGQTIGKMAAGIRVVAGTPDSQVYDRVTLKQAVLRALLTFPSVLVLGAGFFPALLGSHLALHDRFTHTRVVRA
jgi:uncharacterized RDD family membrane protein YckC